MNWNQAEYGLQRLARAVFQLDGTYSTALLVHVGTGTLVDAIRAVLPFRKLHSAVVTHVDDGLAWFLDVRAERNTFVHSIYHPSWTEPGLRRIGASSKAGKLNFREERLDLAVVRALAEEMYDLGAFLQTAATQLDRSPPLDPGTRKFRPGRWAAPERLSATRDSKGSVKRKRVTKLKVATDKNSEISK